MSKQSLSTQWLLAGLFLLTLLLAPALTAGAATPFESPTPEYTIHQPLIINNVGEASPIRLDVERDGVPVVWVLGVLALLFIPAAALVTVRRRR